jgi:hypothetical protein
MEWRFKALTRNDTLQNASHLEFFHNEALSSSVDALVREDIQNRLDAKQRNAPFVEVRYRLCGPVASTTRASWFPGLAPHLASAQVRDELGYQPSLESALTWLVIEDFNTTGLEGDPAVFQDPLPCNGTPRNDFFWFVRNVGRSGKKGGDRGRWGLGKIVYPASSKIRSFFAYTVRQSDNRRLIIGRSVLAVHNCGDQQHDSEGYFGLFEDTVHEYFATPDFSDSTITRFKQDFLINRAEHEAGLSLVIPWPDKDITYKALVSSIIDHWFWVILDGRLRVQVSQDGGPSVSINADNIDGVIRNFHDETSLQTQQVLRKLQFGRSAQEMDVRSLNFHHLTISPTGSAPKWDRAEERFNPQESLVRAREAFHAGRMIGFDVPVNVRRVDGQLVEDASFEVYLQKTELGHPPVEVFLREGLCISGQKFLREPGTLAIVKIEDDALGTMLGDAENPAHTRWERLGKHFRDRYTYGPSILSYVQRSAQHLCSLLSRRPEGLDHDLLKNLFYLPEPGTLPTPAPRPPGPGPTPPVPPLPAREIFVECTKVAGGFRLRRHPRATRAPAFIQVRAAYEVIRGNPFRFHHSADFNFSRPTNIQLNLSGVSVQSAEPSKLLLSVESPDFQVTVTGFDQNRDLVVDVKPLHTASAGNPDDELPLSGDEGVEV